MTLSNTARLVIETTAKSEGVPVALIKEAFAMWEGRGLTAAQSKEPRQLLTVAEAADFLRVSRTSLFRSEKEGHLKSVRFRGRKLFKIEDLKAALVAGNEVKV